jgi:hypothetical protein
MSGYKHATVTISQEEYQRLHATDMKNKFRDFAKVRSHDSGRDESILNLIQQLEERERQLMNVLSSSGQSFTEVDGTIFQAIQEQTVVNYQQMINTLRNSCTNIQESLAVYSDSFSRELQIDRETNIQYLQTLFFGQELAQEREYAKEEAAEFWLNRCGLMAEFIQTQFDHERFTPGRFEKILRNLNYAENNLNQGFSESCLQTSQQMYLELYDLNIELEQHTLQWHTLFGETYSAINELIAQMTSNADIRALGLSGEELPDYINLDFWTNGRFQHLLEHCRQLTIYMVQDQNILTFEDIQRINSQILPTIRETFEKIIFDARLNALNSQLRMNIAEKALQALENHGFVLDEAGYSDNDMRSQFNAHLECPDGSQVLIQVLPTEQAKEDLSNDLVVITTHPFLKTEHEARMHWDELSQSLAKYNLRVSRPQIMAAPSTLTIQETERTSSPTRLYSQSEG